MTAAGPDTSKTFGDLIRDVAEELGLADYTGTTPAAPTRAGDLDVVKRAIADGCELFYRGMDPREGGRKHRWTFLTPTIRVTIDPAGTDPATIEGDIARYRLDRRVTSGPHDNWTWELGTQAWSGEVMNVREEVVRQLHANQTNTGPPLYATVRAYPPLNAAAPQDRQGWEVWVWPDPDQVYTLSAKFPVWPRKMLHPDERHLAGPDHDMTIIAASVYAHFRKRRTADPEKAEVQARFDREMIASIETDLQNLPKTAGRNDDPATTYYADEAYDVRTTRPIVVNGVTIS